MTVQRDSRQAVAPAPFSIPATPGSEHQSDLADMVSPPLPDGTPALLGNRVMVYLRPAKVGAVLGLIDVRTSGMILAGAKPYAALKDLRGKGIGFPVLIDPASYETFTATCQAPFCLPGVGSLTGTLGNFLDDQMSAGVAAAMSPTGFIPAGATDVLRAAASQFGQLGHPDSIFVAPIDISLIGRAYFKQTAAILAAIGRPVAVVLGGQGDPVSYWRDIIPNLRSLAASVPLIAMRTDFNGMDLVAHGAICAAIGTGGSVRHTVDPAEKKRAFVRDQSPSVLWPELASWHKGSTINEFFGARPNLAPRCACIICDGQRINRFLRREHQDEAIAHGVAVWSGWARDMLAAATMRGRAEYWKNLCTGAVQHYSVFLQLLNRLDGLAPQDPLKWWSTLPAWPEDAHAPVS